MNLKFRTISSIVLFTLLITSGYATSNPFQAFAATPVLLGATGQNLSTLYDIDPATGTANSIGAINDPVSGLDYFGTTLFGEGENILMTIDPSSGAEPSTHPTANKCSDISFSPSGTLYCISPDATTLYTIDPTSGSASTVGVTGLTGHPLGGAIAVTSDGTIFAGNLFGLFTLNPSTGAASTVTPWVFPQQLNNNCRPSAFDFDNSGTLYASFTCGSQGSPVSYLTTIDTTNAQVTLKGLTVTGLDAIAFTPPATPPSIPEFPFSFSLVIMFVVVAAVYMGMRQKMTFGKPRL